MPGRVSHFGHTDFGHTPLVTLATLVALRQFDCFFHSGHVDFVCKEETAVAPGSPAERVSQPLHKTVLDIKYANHTLIRFFLRTE